MDTNLINRCRRQDKYSESEVNPSDHRTPSLLFQKNEVFSHTSQRNCPIMHVDNELQFINKLKRHIYTSTISTTLS